MNQSFGLSLGFITPFIYSLYETAAFVDAIGGTNQINPARATPLVLAGMPAAASAGSTERTARRAAVIAGPEAVGKAGIVAELD
jgi:hypothetical protein